MPAAAAPPTSVSVPFQLKPPPAVRLHGAPFDRDADAVDAAPLQALELFGGRRRLRSDAPEIARYGAGAGGEAARHGGERQDRERSGPRTCPPRKAPALLRHGLAGLRRERGAGAVPLAPLANHKRGERDRREHRRRNQDRHQRRGPVVGGGGRRLDVRGGRLHLCLAGGVIALVWATLARAAARARVAVRGRVALTFRRWRSFFRITFARPGARGRFGAAGLGRLGRLRDVFVLLGATVARQGRVVLDRPRVGLSQNRKASKCQQSKH